MNTFRVTDWLRPTTDAMVHAGVAAVVSCTLSITTSPYWGAAVPIIWFHAREMAHATAKNPLLERFFWRQPFPWYWHVTSIREFVHPSLIAIIVAVGIALVS